MKSHHDTLQRFLFEHAPVRGEIVHLDATWHAVLERHDYPPVLRQVLGELMAAATLLAATLKLKGSLILQVQGKGPVSLLVVECSGELSMRATAHWEGELPTQGLAALIGEGRFVITLDPKDGNQAYQGIVPTDGNSIAEILQHYMLHSEQLDTRFWLAADEHQLAGMLLQKLPETSATDTDTDAWERFGHLAATLKQEELLQLSGQEILHRLFHEEDVRLFEPQIVTFRCTCTRQNVANMLRMLGQDEVRDILSEQGRIETKCEFCNQHYHFDAVDAEQLFAAEIVAPGSKTTH